MAATSSLPLVPIHQVVTVRLTKSNYLLWRAQLLPYLRSSKLIGFLDGSNPSPMKTKSIITAAGTTDAPNPEYERWYDQDQQLLSGLLSSMTEEVLQDVVDAPSARAVWESLQRKFASSSKARIVQVRLELATAKKRDLSAVDFFHRITGLATELAAAGAPLRDDEVLSYLLAGLPADYDPLVTAMTTKSDAVSLDDVFAHLVAFEARRLQHQAKLQLHIGASANYAGRGGGIQHSRGRNDRGRGLVVVLLVVE